MIFCGKRICYFLLPETHDHNTNTNSISIRAYHKIPRFLDTNTNKTSEDIKQLKNYDNDTKTN